MYFEPSKKTYYRFPSTNNISNLDSRYFFPEKSGHTVMDTRFDSTYASQASEHDTFYHEI
jgi:hypothetical protein